MTVGENGKTIGKPFNDQICIVLRYLTRVCLCMRNSVSYGWYFNSKYVLITNFNAKLGLNILVFGVKIIFCLVQESNIINDLKIRKKATLVTLKTILFTKNSDIYFESTNKGFYWRSKKWIFNRRINYYRYFFRIFVIFLKTLTKPKYKTGFVIINIYHFNLRTNIN